MRLPLLLPLAAILFASAARADETSLTLAQAIDLAHRNAPDLFVAKENEVVAAHGIGVAGIYPNPTLSVGTSTKTAKVSGTLSVPLVILGQIGASKDAARAEYTTVTIESEIVWTEVRASTAHAFVDLWRAERIADARDLASKLADKLDEAVAGRVETGASPPIEGLRAHAERLSVDAASVEATQMIGAARSGLGRWIGVPTGVGLHTVGDLVTPNAPPTLTTLLARLDGNPQVRRESADAAAAEARADRERAYVRPAMFVELGFDYGDPTLDGTNYRGLLGIEVPLFNFRGPLIDREKAAADLARARENSVRARLTAELTTAFLTFEAATSREKALDEAVVPAAKAAADAIEESYTLGRAALVAVLDAERARLDAIVSLVEARVARANAWIEVERLVGAP